MNSSQASLTDDLTAKLNTSVPEDNTDAQLNTPSSRPFSFFERSLLKCTPQGDLNQLLALLELKKNAMVQNISQQCQDQFPDMISQVFPPVTGSEKPRLLTQQTHKQEFAQIKNKTLTRQAFDAMVKKLPQANSSATIRNGSPGNESDPLFYQSEEGKIGCLYFVGEDAFQAEMNFHDILNFKMNDNAHLSPECGRAAETLQELFKTESSFFKSHEMQFLTAHLAGTIESIKSIKNDQHSEHYATNSRELTALAGFSILEKSSKLDGIQNAPDVLKYLKTLEEKPDWIKILAEDFAYRASQKNQDQAGIIKSLDDLIRQAEQRKKWEMALNKFHLNADTKKQLQERFNAFQQKLAASQIVVPNTAEQQLNDFTTQLTWILNPNRNQDLKAFIARTATQQRATEKQISESLVRYFVSLCLIEAFAEEGKLSFTQDALLTKLNSFKAKHSEGTIKTLSEIAQKLERPSAIDQLMSNLESQPTEEGPSQNLSHWKSLVETASKINYPVPKLLSLIKRESETNLDDMTVFDNDRVTDNKSKAFFIALMLGLSIAGVVLLNVISMGTVGLICAIVGLVVGFISPAHYLNDLFYQRKEGLPLFKTYPIPANISPIMLAAATKAQSVIVSETPHLPAAGETPSGAHFENNTWATEVLLKPNAQEVTSTSPKALPTTLPIPQN